MRTTHIKLKGRSGTYSIVSNDRLCGSIVFLLESEQYMNSAEYVVVNAYMEVLGATVGTLTEWINENK